MTNKDDKVVGDIGAGGAPVAPGVGLENVGHIDPETGADVGRPDVAEKEAADQAKAEKAEAKAEKAEAKKAAETK